MTAYQNYKNLNARRKGFLHIFEKLIKHQENYYNDELDVFTRAVIEVIENLDASEIEKLLELIDSVHIRMQNMMLKEITEDFTNVLTELEKDRIIRGEAIYV